MRLRSSFALTLFALGVTRVAASSSDPFVVHEQIKVAPVGFQKRVSGSLAEQSITLRIQLAQNNISGLETELYAISTPGSAKYGRHLSVDEVVSYVRLTDDTTFIVENWLSQSDLIAKKISDAGDWLEITLPVPQANELLDSDFGIFVDLDGQEVIRTLNYSIPASLVGHIDLIHPTVNFPIRSFRPDITRRDASERSEASSSCEAEVVPSCLQQLYAIPTTPATTVGNSLYVSGFGENADHSDVSGFLTDFRPDIPSTVNTTFSVIDVNNGTNIDDPEIAGDEAMLDLEYTVGLATGVPVTYLAVGQTNFTNPSFLDAVLAEAILLAGLENPPWVLTTSYGVDETDVTPAFANSICNLYMQLGARGTSVIYASGDGGVGGSHGDNCAGEPFIPDFPAVCPYVTAVGGTELLSTGESAATFSSGGFSNIFSRPSYQDASVNAYISSLGSTYSDLYNSSGRGFPDVAALGSGFLIYIQGSIGFLISGTSCASPTFASVIALLNDRLISAGKSPLGFLNPFLYANPSTLNDITTGDNPGCGTNGFNATVGWDPISGLGSPNFTALLATLVV